MLKKIGLIVFILFILFPIKINANTILNETENYYFYLDGCLSCKTIDKKIEHLNNFKKIKIDNNNLKDVKIFIKDKYNIEDFKAPLLIYNSNVYIGELEINNYINSKNNYIYILGFIDGLNPCAISILMIFLSFLIVSDKKNKMLFIGFSFIFGQGVTNFILGIGLLKFSSLLKEFDIIFKIIIIITLLICFFVILINFIDIYNYINKKNNTLNILPRFIRNHIINIISINIDSKYLIFISFFMGSTIAFLEFGCTGQIYLPTVLTFNKFDITSIILLLWYNIMFSIPLFITFIISFLIKPEKIKDIVNKYSYLLKILMNIVLIFLLFLLFHKLI